MSRGKPARNFWCAAAQTAKSNADTITAGLQGGVELLMWIKRSTILDKQNTAK